MKKNYTKVLFSINAWLEKFDNSEFSQSPNSIKQNNCKRNEWCIFMFVFVSFFICTSIVKAATVTWALTNAPGSGVAAPVNTNINIADVVVGTNFNTTTFGATDGMATAGGGALKGWNEINQANAIANLAFIEFGVTVLNCSTSINITGISFTTKTSAGTIPTVNSLFRYSTDNFLTSFNVGTNGQLSTQANTTGNNQTYSGLNITCPANTTITFRLYGWGIGADPRVLNIKNFQLTATYPVPTAVTGTCVVNKNVCSPGSSNGEATATGAGGTGPYTYNWSTGSTTANTTNLAAGSYTVTVTDANGCTGTKSVTIQEPGTALSVVCNKVDITCFGANNGSVTATASNGIPNYQYLWSNAKTTTTITGLSAGTYTVTITDNLGCQAFCSQTITGPSSGLTINCSKTNITCNGASNGTASAAVSGGTTPYSYSWSTGQTTQNVAGLGSGAVSCTVTDFKGCTASCNLNIAEPGLLVIQCSTDQQVCNPSGTNGAAHVTVISGGTSPYSYLWSNGTSTSTNTGLAAGIYTVTVSDGNNCTKTCSLTITQPSLSISISPTPTNVNCKGLSTGSLISNASGGYGQYTYAWSNSSTTANLSNIPAGIYTVTVTDVNGCTKTQSTTVTEPATVLSVVVDSVNNVKCNGDATGNIFITPSGATPGYTYSWSNGSSSQDIQNVAAGTYTVTVTDQNGCTKTKTSVITAPATSPSAVASTSANVLCFGGNNGSVTVTASGGTPGNPPNEYSYLWSTTPASTTNSVTGLTAAIYVVTVTDDNGCTATATCEVTQPTQLSEAISAIKDTLCQGETLNLQFDTVFGGVTPYSFSWTGPGGYSSNQQNPVINNAQPVNSGNYNVIITDANLCSLSDIIGNIKVYEMPVLTTATPIEICSGTRLNETLTTQINNGITYSWTVASDALINGFNPNPNQGTANTISDSLVNSSFGNVGNGSYFVQLVFTNGLGFQCVNIDTLKIIVNPKPPEPDFLSIENLVNNNTICGGTENLSFSIPGVSGFNFSWEVNPGSIHVGLSDDNNPPYDSTSVIISFPDSTNPYQATILASSYNIDSLGGCKSNPKLLKLFVRPGGITERPIVLRDPGHLLIYLDNTVDGYQWGYDSLPTLKPEIVPGQIFQVFVPDENKFLTIINDRYQLDTLKYLFWVNVYEATGDGDTCMTKVYYNGPYAKRPGTTPEVVPTEITAAISPNPNSGAFDLLVSGNIYGSLRLEVYNVVGQLVSETSEDKSKGAQTYKMDIGKLERGIYVLRLSDEFGENYVLKFLIN